ncbi:MAG: histidine kinase, partial [Coriobacteriia bacterium]|nr:histidine kinase [Coriobacteriia bacterium]
FSTATIYMKDHIRGVGSGLPIVNEFLSHGGGSLAIEDNLGRGTVVTLSFEPAANPKLLVGQDIENAAQATEIDLPPLSLRQKKVLSLVMEIGEVGPTLVSKELAVGLSTAYRDLASLEDFGLIEADESGKRVLTGSGSAFLGRLFD